MTKELSLRLSQTGLKHAGAFMFYLLAFFLPYQMEFYIPQLFGVSLTPMNVLSFCLLIFLSFKILISLRLPVIPHSSLWLLFVIMASIAYALGPRVTSPLQGVWVIFRLAVVPPLFYVGAVSLFTAAEVQKAVKIIAISAALAGFIAAVQVLTGGQVLSGYLTNHRYLGIMQPLPPEVVANYSGALVTKLYLAGTNIYRGHGTFYSHNFFGAFICITACLTWGSMRGATSKHKWFWLIVFIAQVIGAIASFSRSSWAALVAGIGIAILTEVVLIGGKRAISRILRLVPVLLILMIIIGVIVSRSEKIAEHFITIFSPGKTPEFQWRQLVWETAFQKIATHPWLGSGTGDVYTTMDWAGQTISYSAHNLFVGIAYELGIPTLIIFSFFTISLFYSAWRCSRYAQQLPDRMLAVGFVAAGVAFLVSGVGSVLMNIENMAVLFWLMVGVTVILRREVKPYHRSVKEVQGENLDGRISAVATSN